MNNLANNTADFKEILISEIRDEINNSDFPHYKYILHYSKCNVRIYQDLTIEGDLNLDERIDGVCVIVVEGNLTVEGNIYNKDGVYLYVKGKTTAKNLIAGQPVVSLNEVEIDNFIVGYGNDGTLSTKILKTNILINYELAIEYREKTIFLSYDSDIQGNYTEELYDFEQSHTNTQEANFITFDEDGNRYLEVDELIKSGSDTKLAEVMIHFIEKA